MLVSALLVRQGLTLIQEPCEAKSNEIMDIPCLLECMVLEGAVVIIDAVGCQWAIVQDLHATEVRAAFEEAERGAFTPEVQDHCETVERNGGRRERRTCTVLGGPAQPDSGASVSAWNDTNRRSASSPPVADTMSPSNQGSSRMRTRSTRGNRTRHPSSPDRVTAVGWREGCVSACGTLPWLGSQGSPVVCMG